MNCNSEPFQLFIDDFIYPLIEKHLYNADEMDRKPVTTRLMLMLKWEQHPFSCVDANTDANTNAQCDWYNRNTKNP